MKVRIGYGIGTQGLADGGARFAELIDALEELRFDSIWCSERATGPIPEPMVSLAFAAGRTKKLKLGTSVQVLPGRNPVLLAKQWASLDVLSGGRALPAFGLGVVEPHEQQAFGVTREERAPWFEEALPLIRRLWSEDTVDHDGPRFHYEGVSIGTRPVQQPPDVWLGGRAPRELRRVGELADGWLPSFCTPATVAEGREQVETAAAAAGRAIDDEHYGAMVFYGRTEVPEPYASMVGARLGFDPGDVIVVGIPALRDRLEEYLAVGFSKLVLVPVQEADSWRAEVEELADGLLDLQGTRRLFDRRHALSSSTSSINPRRHNSRVGPHGLPACRRSRRGGERRAKRDPRQSPGADLDVAVVDRDPHPVLERVSNVGRPNRRRHHQDAAVGRSAPGRRAPTCRRATEPARRRSRRSRPSASPRVWRALVAGPCAPGGVSVTGR